MMNTTTLPSGIGITALAAECFTLARIAATGIEEDVLDLALPAAKQIANALLANIRRGTILNDGVLTLLEELIDAIEDEIDDGARCITRYDHSPENVSANTCWRETRISPEAERLTNALVVLEEFYVFLLPLYAVLQVEQALEGARAAP